MSLQNYLHPFDKNSVKKLIIAILILFVFSIFSLYVYKTYIVHYMHTTSITMASESSKTQTTNYFEQDDVVTQIFVSPADELKSIDLMFSKQGSQGEALIDVSLSDKETSQLYYQTQISASQISDLAYTPITLDTELVGIKDVKLLLKLTVLQKDDSLILTMPLSNDKNMHTGLFVNDQPLNCDMAYKLMGGTNEFIKPLFLTLFFVLFLFICLLFFMIFYTKIKFETIFLVSLILFGLVYMFVFPPFSIPDEFTHVGSSYRYASKILGHGFGDHIAVLVRDGDFSNFLLKDVPIIDTFKLILNNFFSLAPQNDELYSVVMPFAGNWCQYIFSTAGIIFARILNLGYIPMLYMGRLFNFIFFVFMSYISMKKMPFGKTMLASIIFMPLTMMLSISYSYDVIMISLSIFFIAQVLNMAYTQRDIKWYDILQLCLAGGFLVAGKAGIYSLVCLTVLIIPIKRFKKKSAYFISLGAIALICLLFMVKFNLMNIIGVSSSAVGSTTLNPDGSAVQARTFSSIFTNIWGFIDIIINTLNIELRDITLTLLGNRLSYLNVVVPFYAVIATLLILILSSIKVSDEQNYISTKTKSYFTAISLMLFFAFLVVAYTWTTNADSTIRGVQGRYFIPVLPLILFLFRSDNLTFKKDITGKLHFSMALVNVFALMYTFSSFITKNTLFIGGASF
ncbi:MAG: DUF2142 domain-containing protein [Clostridia bacterium]|nr:DUF2142 domain-containing protein [Clostridia bacterium]